LFVSATGSRAQARAINVSAGQSLRSALEAARAGDTINVGAGTYHASQLVVPSGVRLISSDGPGKARLDGDGRGETLRMYGERDITIDGFEIFHAGENIVKMEGARNITVRRCKIHDAGQDCVKVTIGSHFITIEDCE